MKLYLPSGVARNIRKAVSRDDVAEFSKLAAPLKWGKPSWSASQLLLEALKEDVERLWLWADKLSNHKDPLTRRYAPRILAELWKDDKNKVAQILTSLADDEHWLVREDAHAVWSELLKEHFQQVFPILRKWGKHSTPNLRRCVAIAVRSAGNLRKKEWAAPLIRLIEPLLSDTASYVRKNLGPYAIGDGLLRCYPDLTLKHLRRWAYREDEGTRWNVAMAFASYGGNKNWQEGMEILATLAKDERRYVWRAVASSMLYLARRHSEVQEVLEKWLTDPERFKVAETALRYLKKNR